MSPAQVRQKVENYLRNSQLLAEQRQQPITPAELQREMERMAGDTKQPEVLGELFSALGNDPAIIAECLARQVLTERLKGGVPEVLDEVSGGYTLPRIAGSSSTCADDSWTATNTTNAPSVRVSHTAIWTGTEMIVWGGAGAVFENTGGRYNPGTDSWVATTVGNVPAGRQNHTAVWTGSEMIVWGGFFLDGGGIHHLNTGGRYNPNTDSWVGTTTTNAPIERQLHTAVWTGNEMIAWGGFSGGVYRSTGGRYNPITNSWVATTDANPPEGRAAHTAVWTGSAMIVWGGSSSSAQLNTGARYNPSTNSWVATTITNAPAVRASHTAVWTGGEMIVWGGGSNGSLNTGSRYDPSTDSWTAITSTDAPVARQIHTAVWTGSEMIVWGGGNSGGELNSGGRYCGRPGTLGNISTRVRVETGNNVLIGGFIINGSAPKNVVVRGIGPSLAQFGIPDALADPTLELRDSGGTLVRQNDNWQDDASQASQLTALGFALQNSNESGMIASLSPAAYTAVLAGKNGGTGLGLVEIYDTNAGANSQLANISTRGFVLTGSNVMIGGFILGGANNTHVVVRGIGPSLAQFGLSPVLADPTLELRDSNGALLISNDNWQDNSASASQLTALGLALANATESGIHVSLSPGAFTAILAGKNGGTGIGLVEIYNVH
jgi:hypothetical protein